MEATANYSYSNLGKVALRRVVVLLGILIAALALLMIFNAGSASAAPISYQYVYEDIDADTTWTSDNVYIVNATVSIVNGATLTIQANTTVLFDNGVSFYVTDGSLVADADGGEPIVFSSNSSTPSTGGWSGILVAETGSAELDNVEIWYALVGLSSDNATVSIKDSTISDVAVGVYLVKDYGPIVMSIDGLTVDNYAIMAVGLISIDQGIDLELADCTFNGLDGSTGVLVTANADENGTVTVLANNVAVTGGDSAFNLLAAEDLELRLAGCTLSGQADVALIAESVNADAKVWVTDSTIDGSGAEGAVDLYTLNEVPYEYSLIVPDAGNWTTGGAELHAILPWDFPFMGGSYNDVYMYTQGYLYVDDWANWIIPAYNSDLWSDGGSSFFGYKVYDDHAVFQWSVYYSGDSSVRMDIFQAVLFPNGEVQFNYNMMESDIPGDIDIGYAFYPFDYDMMGILGNPFTLEQRSFLLHPVSISPGAGIYTAAFDGDIYLNITGSTVQDFGDGAIWAVDDHGDIQAEVAGTTIQNVITGDEDAAFDLEAQNGTINANVKGCTFNTIWGWAFIFESYPTMGGSEVVAVEGNSFTRVALIGGVASNIINYFDDAGAYQYTSQRSFNDNQLVDSAQYGSFTYISVDESSWTVVANDEMVGNTVDVVLYTGTWPIPGDWEGMGAMFNAMFGFIGTEGGVNSVTRDLTIADNVVTELAGDMEGGVNVYEDTETDDGNLTSVRDLKVNNNQFATAYYGLDYVVAIELVDTSYQEMRTSLTNLEVKDNVLLCAQPADTGSPNGVEIDVNDWAQYTTTQPWAVMSSSTMDVSGNNVTGVNDGLNIEVYRGVYNFIGTMDINDVYSMNDNVVTEFLNNALGISAYYYDQYDDFFPPWEEVVSSTINVNYEVQMDRNVVESGLFSNGDYMYVDIESGAQEPGNVVFTDANLVATGTIELLDNQVTMHSQGWAMNVYDYIWAQARTAMAQRTSTITIEGNQIISDALSNDYGINVDTESWSLTHPWRDNLPDVPTTTAVTTVSIANNLIDGCSGGIEVDHYAWFEYSTCAVVDTYDLSVDQNEILGVTEDGGIYVYNEVSPNYTAEPLGTVTMDWTTAVTGNEVQGDVTLNSTGINVEEDSLASVLATGSDVYSVLNNEIDGASSGIIMDIYSPASVQLSSTVSGNIISNVYEYGIELYGDPVLVQDNRMTGGVEAYGIYAYLITGTIQGNSVTDFTYAGLYIDNCYDLAVLDNQITYCGLADMDYGVLVYYSSNVTVEGNDISYNGNGLYVNESGPMTIVDNTVNNNTGEGGYAFYLYGGRIEGNSFSGNGGNGANLVYCYDVVFGNNTVSKNLNSGLYVYNYYTDEKVTIYNGMYEYNGYYGINIDDQYGLIAETWIIDAESRATVNDMRWEGDITVLDGGELFLDSVDEFNMYWYASGMPTITVNQEGMLKTLNSNINCESGNYKFLVNGMLDAEATGIFNAWEVYLGPTSVGELRGCLLSGYYMSGVHVDNCAAVISECILLGDSYEAPGMTEGILIEGTDANPTIVGNFILNNRHGIYARDATLGSIYDNMFVLNRQAGIYGENVEGTIHDNVLMLNKVEILLTEGSTVTVSDNEIGWTRNVQALADYAPFIELVAHHIYEISTPDLGMGGGSLGAGPLDFLNSNIAADLILGHVGVVASDSEVTVSGNTFGMVYQAVYVTDSTLQFSGRIEPSTLTIPYYIGLNSSSMSIKVQCVEGLYAVRSTINVTNAYIEVLDDAITLEDCNGAMLDATLKAGDKQILVVPTSSPGFSADGQGFQVMTWLKVIATDNDGDPQEGRAVEIKNSAGEIVKSGVTDANGVFQAAVLAYTATSSGNVYANPYNVTVDFKNGDKTASVAALDPLSSVTEVTIAADKDNTMLFIGIAVLAIVLLLLVLAVIMRRKR